MNSCQLGAESIVVDQPCANCPYVRGQHSLRRVNAVLEEQARSIGQALHDETGQTLTAAHHALAEAYELSESSVRIHLAAVKNNLEAIDQQLRRLAHELRPRILDDLGLVPALRFLADGMSVRGEIVVSLTTSLGGPLPAVVETAVYRLVQESLTNIRRHARATQVVLEVEERPGLLRCRIRDNGVGFDAEQQSPSGLGLIGIRDRLDDLGATLTVDSEPGRGTDLLTMIPLEDRDACPHSPY
jgi:signal transduction histidine kinase